MAKGKTKTEITHVHGSGNKDGGNFGAGVRITREIKPNKEVYVQGDINRNQSFKGNGGQTSGGIQIGGAIKF